MKPKFKIEYHQEPIPKRKSSFWFTGHVATIEFGTRYIEVHAQGQTRVMFTPNGNWYEGDQAIDEAIDLKLTDTKLRGLNKHDGWGDNNWFELLLVQEKTKEEWECDMKNIELWRGKLKEWLKYKKDFSTYKEDFEISEWAEDSICNTIDEAISQAKSILTNDKCWD